MFWQMIDQIRFMFDIKKFEEWSDTYLSRQQRLYFLWFLSFTLIARRQQCRRLFHHCLDYFSHRLKIFFNKFVKFIHVEMISRKKIFFDRFVLIQTFRAFIHHELLNVISLIEKHERVNRFVFVILCISHQHCWAFARRNKSFVSYSFFVLFRRTFSSNSSTSRFSTRRCSDWTFESDHRRIDSESSKIFRFDSVHWLRETTSQRIICQSSIHKFSIIYSQIVLRLRSFEQRQHDFVLFEILQILRITNSSKQCAIKIKDRKECF